MDKPTNRARFIILGVLVLLTVMLVGMAWSIRQAMQDWQQDFLAHKQTELKRYAREISYSLELPFNVLDGIASNPVLNDSIVNNDPQATQAFIEQQLLAVAYNHPLFFKVRWVDSEGEEILRLTRTPEGIERATYQENIASYPFHANIVKQPSWTIFIARVGLNREYGQLEMPPRPTLRFALRLPAVNGDDLGYLLLNVDSRLLLNEEAAANRDEIFLADRLGAWLRHANSQWTWRHELGHSVGVDTVHPELYQRLLEFPSGVMTTEFGHWVWASTNADVVAVSSALVRSDATTYLIWRLDQSAWQAALAREIEARIPLFLATVIVLLVGAFWLNRYLLDRQRWLDIITEQRDQLRARSEKAEQLVAAKSLFLANMSHEIRTPMNAIVGYLELLQTSAMSPTQRDQLEHIRMATNGLMAIVNDVLDLSKLEQQQVSILPSWVEIERVIGQPTAIFHHQALKKSIKLLAWIDPHLPRQVKLDSARVGQVLNNFISNAIKFSEQGYILVSAHQVATDGRHVTVRFAVRDQGKGIAADKLNKVFQYFSQEDDSITRRYGGTGLGLAISQRLVQLMGGQGIDVDSQVNRGSEFSFTLVSECIEVEPQLNCPPADVYYWRPDDEVDLVIKPYLDAWLSKQANSSAAQQAVLLCNEQQVFAEQYEIEARMQSLQARLLVIAEPTNMHALVSTLAAVSRVSYVQRPVLPGDLQRALCQSEPASVAQTTPIPTTMGILANVAVIDDTPTNLMVAQAMLAKLNIGCTAFESGEAFLMALADGQAFDLVFLDIHMPNMSGLQVVQEIRQRLGLVNLPVIALSAAAMEEDVEQSIAAGMTEHMAKPYTLEQLKQRIERYLK